MVEKGGMAEWGSGWEMVGKSIGLYGDIVWNCLDLDGFG